MKSNEHVNQIMVLQNNKQYPKRGSRVSLYSNVETTASLGSVTKFTSGNFNKKKSFFYCHEQMIATEEETRRDAYGVSISKGGKDHHVSFVDVISRKKFAEITEIDIQETTEKGKRVKCTGCSIF